MSLRYMSSRQASTNPSTEPTLPCKTHTCTEIFHYTSGLIEGFWSQESFDEETVCAFEIWGFVFFFGNITSKRRKAELQGTKSHILEGRAGETIPIKSAKRSAGT